MGEGPSHQNSSSHRVFRDLESELVVERPLSPSLAVLHVEAVLEPELEPC